MTNHTLSAEDGTLQVLHPLSKNTENLLDPVEFGPDDALLIDLSKDGRRFVLRPERIEKAESRAADTFRFNGELYRPSRTRYVRSTIARFPERFPENKRINKDSMWSPYEVAATDVSALILRHCIPLDRIIWLSPEAQTTFVFLLGRFFAQNDRAKIQAEYKLNGQMPELPEDWVDHPTLPCAPYQKVAVTMGLGQEALAVFADPGTGKTIVSIQRICLEALRKRKGTDEPLRTLIVCPNAVRLQWQNEIRRFSVARGRATVIRGGSLKRKKLLTYAMQTDESEDFAACILGYETTVNEQDILVALGLGFQWDLIIVDESHMFKSPRTERWKALRRLRDVSKMRMILTGTPIGNTTMDLFTQLEFLFEGGSGFIDYKEFKNFYANWRREEGQGGTVHEVLEGLKNMALLQERLARVSFSITKKEANLNLPDKLYDIHEVTMFRRQAEIYNKIANDIAVEIEHEDLSGEMTVSNVLTRLLRLEQITAGFWTKDAVEDEHGNVISESVTEAIPGAPNPKIDAVMELLEADWQSDPSIKATIWCRGVPEIRALSARLERHGIRHGCYYGSTSEKDREAMVCAFNHDPEFKVMVVNIQAGGTGLNLVGYDYDHGEECGICGKESTPEPQLNTDCAHMIRYSRNWSSLQAAQAEDRQHRRGTRRPVRITDLIVPYSIDEEIKDRVEQKQDMADLVTNISDILKTVLPKSFEGEAA